MEKINEATSAVKQRSNIPDHVFDIEYSTQWRDEVDFLASRGIYYTYRKFNPEYRVSTFKYTKTADLFVALADFYLRRRRDVKSKATYDPRKPKQVSMFNKDGFIKDFSQNLVDAFSGRGADDGDDVSQTETNS